MYRVWRSWPGPRAARQAYPDATPQETRSASWRPRPNLRTGMSIRLASDGLARDFGRRVDDEAVFACALRGVERFVGSTEELVGRLAGSRLRDAEACCQADACVLRDRHR